MNPPAARSWKRVLDPYDRVSEVLFGLIMVLTFTGSLSIAEAGRDDVRTMLIGALGCNLAWGVIDAVLYLMGCLADQNRGLMLLRSLRRTPDPQSSQKLVAEALPPVVVSALGPKDIESLRLRLLELPEAAGRGRLGRDEWVGALGVFLLVFLSTFPVVTPFIFMENARVALRISNAIAIAMLFATGWGFGRLINFRPWGTGVVMVVLGFVLVGLTMALGG